jgi:hypothetical protein
MIKIPFPYFVHANLRGHGRNPAAVWMLMFDVQMAVLLTDGPAR